MGNVIFYNYLVMDHVGQVNGMGILTALNIIAMTMNVKNVVYLT